MFHIYDSVQKQHNWKTILTYKNIDKKAFFAIPERYKCIDDILVELEKPGESKWPCSKDEEWLINRQITNQIWSTPHYKFSASRELSCSMRLEVLPWALIINNLGCEIKLINSTDKNSCLIQPNHIAIPMAIAVIDLGILKKIEKLFNFKKKINFRMHLR